MSVSAHVSRADLGGQLGHGRVLPEAEGELWHAAWEPRVLAMTLAMGATGQWNIDMSRAARESLPGYAAMSYYEIWLHGLLKLMLERGLVTEEEVTTGEVRTPPRTLARVLREADVPRVLAQVSPTERRIDAPPRFAVGDAVRCFDGDIPHHTRLPAYVRGRHGTVVAQRGAHVFADAHATGRGEMPCHLYSVAFDGRELWGHEAEAGGLLVSVDAWEPYLSPA